MSAALANTPDRLIVHDHGAPLAEVAGVNGLQTGLPVFLLRCSPLLIAGARC
jgi:hypothetical protein